MVCFGALSAVHVGRSAFGGKGLTKNIDSLALTWMQQAFALPFIAVSLVLMPFYWPQELSGHLVLD